MPMPLRAARGVVDRLEGTPDARLRVWLLTGVPSLRVYALTWTCGVDRDRLEETPDDFALVDEWLALVDDRLEERPCAGAITSKLARRRMASLISSRRPSFR